MKLPKRSRKNFRVLEMYTLETIFNFGKHCDKQVEDVLEDDPEYIEWMTKNEIRDFDEEALERFSKAGISS